MRCLFPYLQRRGRLLELATLGALALDAARREGDSAAEAQALTDLAGMHFMSGRNGEALALNDQALALWRVLGLVSCVRRGLNNRGLLLEGLGRHDESAESLRQSLALAKELADPLSEAITLSHLGNLYEHTDARAAIDHHERSLAIGEALGHAVVRQSGHCNIGYAHLTLGEPAAALTHFEESLRIHGEYEDWHGESQARLGLVRALRGLARTGDAARECAALLDRAEQQGRRPHDGPGPPPARAAPADGGALRGGVRAVAVGAAGAGRHGQQGGRRTAGPAGGAVTRGRPPERRRSHPPAHFASA